MHLYFGHGASSLPLSLKDTFKSYSSEYVHSRKPFFFFFFKLWLHRVLVAAGTLLSCGMRVGSSSLTRDPTRAPCTGSVESCPLDHQGSPKKT